MSKSQMNSHKRHLSNPHIALFTIITYDMIMDKNQMNFHKGQRKKLFATLLTKIALNMSWTKVK